MMGVGSLLSAGASIYAANKQADAAENALAMQKSMFDASQANIKEARGGLKPFITTGQGAMYSLAQLYGISTPNGAGGQAFNDNALEAFRKSPDYDWRFKEGMRALSFKDSATGNLLSRGHLNNTVAFGQGLAGMGLGDYTSRLLALSQLGSNAAGTDVSAAAGSGNQAITAGANMGNTIMGKGTAEASGVVGATNAINGGISNYSNGLMLYNALSGNSAYGSGGGLANGSAFNGSMSSSNPFFGPLN